MNKIALFLLLLMPLGCAFNLDNIKWAKENNIKYSVDEISPDKFFDYVNIFKLPHNTICFFIPPNHIFVKDAYSKDGFSSIKNVCLNHEVGHVREYLEGVPPHSKYAL